MASENRVVTNGVYIDTGNLMCAPTDARTMAPAALEQQKRDKGEMRRLKYLDSSRNTAHYGVASFVLDAQSDYADLRIMGWGVIFPRAVTPEEVKRQSDIRNALQPLLDHRRQQAGPLYREILGHSGYGKANGDWLSFAVYCKNTLGIEASVPCDPSKFPYYVMLVGSPREIPFEFQYKLDSIYGVGRLDLGDDLDAYATYAANVVAAETGGLQVARDLAMWATVNPNDGGATALSRAQLAGPLIKQLSGDMKLQGWKYRTYFEDDATRARLETLMGGSETPALLFTAGHGAGIQNFKEAKTGIRNLGSLITQEWNGRGSGPLNDSMLFTADHLTSSANLRGSIIFNFACYGGGTPEFNEIDPGRKSGADREQIAPYPMVSPLHQKVLGLGRGALACIGHIDRAVTYQLPEADGRLGNRLVPFRSAMSDLMKGLPVGKATEDMNARYQAIGAGFLDEMTDLDLSSSSEEVGDQVLDTFMDNWTMYFDARNVVVNGDPAVRLPLAPASAAQPAS